MYCNTSKRRSNFYLSLTSSLDRLPGGADGLVQEHVTKQEHATEDEMPAAKLAHPKATLKSVRNKASSRNPPQQRCSHVHLLAPTPHFSHEADPLRIFFRRVQLFFFTGDCAPQPAGDAHLHAAVFVAMHACTISFAISTAGQPYQDALVERAKLEAKLANGTNETNETGAMLTPSLEEESVPAVNEAVATDKKKVAADKKKVAADKKKVPRRVGGGGGGGFGDEEWPVEEEEEDVAAAAAAQGSTGTTANATLRFNATKAAEERPSRMNGCLRRWRALLFAGATLNCLFYLLCHWLISFKARWLFGPERAPAAGRYLYFVPLDHKGRPALVKLSVANDEQARCAASTSGSGTKCYPQPKRKS